MLELYLYSGLSLRIDRQNIDHVDGNDACGVLAFQITCLTLLVDDSSPTLTMSLLTVPNETLHGITGYLNRAGILALWLTCRDARDRVHARPRRWNYIELVELENWPCHNHTKKRRAYPFIGDTADAHKDYFLCWACKRIMRAYFFWNDDMPMEGRSRSCRLCNPPYQLDGFRRFGGRPGTGGGYLSYCESFPDGTEPRGCGNSFLVKGEAGESPYNPITRCEGCLWEDEKAQRSWETPVQKSRKRQRGA